MPPMGHMNMNVVPPHMNTIPAAMATNKMLNLQAMNQMGASSMRMNALQSMNNRVNPAGQRHQHPHHFQRKNHNLFE